MTKKSILIFAVFVLAPVVIGLTVFSGRNKEVKEIEAGLILKNLGKAPDFTLRDYDDREVSLADFRNKALVINSWAVWCPFCREELRDFAKLQEEFGGEIAVIAIDRQESQEKAKEFTDSIGITEKIIFLLDPKDSFYRAIGGFSMPETIFVDTGGEIRIHKRGPMELEEMREKAEALLNLK